jgi:hypothetical protein
MLYMVRNYFFLLLLRNLFFRGQLAPYLADQARSDGIFKQRYGAATAMV